MLQSSDTSQIVASSIVQEVLRSPGQPLDAQTRGYFQPRFGYDFSRVRVHVGDRASNSAAALGASAYTFGQQVVFGPGRFDPVSSTGRRLIAHELAHTIQQRGSGQEAPGKASAREWEADRAASRVLDRSGIPTLTSSGLAVARQPSGEIPSRASQANIYVAPESGGPYLADTSVRFVVEFVNDNDSPVAEGDKAVEIRASGGQLAWWRSFLRSPIPTPSPKEEKIVSARLWNDATFDYSVKAGIQFTSTRQGEPTKQFFSNDLNFEMPRRGTIRLRFKLEEKQHWEWMTPSPQAGQTALARFRALFPTLGINEEMFRDVVIGRDNSGKILFAFFYLTGAVKLELPPRPTTGSLP